MELRRPHPTDDFDEVLDLLHACDRAVFGDSDWTAAELREEWESIDLGRDAWVAEADGRLVGAMHVYERRGERVLADGYVHPDAIGRGVGARLLEAAERRGLELAEDCPAEMSVSLDTAHLVGDPRAPKLLACRGYSRVRSFHRLVVDLNGEIPPAEWPEGLELRPFVLDRDGRLVHEAIEESFVEEWSHEPREYDVWAERTFGVEQFDPEQILVVWDGDEIAAVSLNYPKRMGNWGWIGLLGVRPAWRRRGLGLSLLHEGFRRFAETGETIVALTVDSDNPTGATRLYERAGMRVLWRADVWSKELRAGAPARAGSSVAELS